MSIEWSGGYLDDNTAIAVLSREGTDEEVWWRHYTVDTRTGAVTGQLNVITMDPNDLKPLGDGTYLVTDADGTLRRL
ncbi:hypothetical protein GCM10023176_62720 [Micromonospora coerulea]|uniref:Uncharacterized protein n=1 Tax=Micromonospora coerulea TaxID=47856 RepID=A0ABP8T534_9ACTN